MWYYYHLNIAPPARVRLSLLRRTLWPACAFKLATRQPSRHTFNGPLAMCSNCRAIRPSTTTTIEARASRGATSYIRREKISPYVVAIHAAVGHIIGGGGVAFPFMFLTLGRPARRNLFGISRRRTPLLLYCHASCLTYKRRGRLSRRRNLWGRDWVRSCQPMSSVTQTGAITMMSPWRR